MRARQSLSDKFLSVQLSAIDRAQNLAQRVRTFHRDERGQTPTEYLMIVGLIAAVIVLVFVTFYWGQVKGAAQSWVKAVKEAILGKGIN
ncbi:MAG: hypothetical protein ABI880_04540 [Acidobacteriota bacterium]